MRIRFAWLKNTQPDVLFEISQLAGVAFEHFEQDARAHRRG